MPKYICYVEDLEVISFEIEAIDEDIAADKAQELLEEYSFDYQKLMEHHNGQQHDGSLEVMVYRTTTDLPAQWTERMHLEDLDD